MDEQVTRKSACCVTVRSLLLSISFAGIISILSAASSQTLQCCPSPSRFPVLTASGSAQLPRGDGARPQCGLSQTFPDYKVSVVVLKNPVHGSIGGYFFRSNGYGDRTSPFLITGHLLRIDEVLGITILEITDTRRVHPDMVVGYTCAFGSMVAPAVLSNLDCSTYLIFFRQNHDNLQLVVITHYIIPD